MLTIAEKEGTLIQVATPHTHDWWLADELPSEIVPRLVKEATHRAQEAGLQITVLPGQECYIQPNLAKDIKEGQWFTLGTSNTVLMELSFVMWPQFLEQVIFNLQLAGYTVVLAHVERYREVQEDPNRLLPLIERGVYMQVNTTSILGRFGIHPEKCVRTLLEHDFVHVIASDAHTTRGRSPGLRKARQRAAEEWQISQETLEKLCFENPRALLADSSFSIPEPREVIKQSKRRWFFDFFTQRAPGKFSTGKGIT
jgi:protein-tyrosine phosphatase